MAGDFSDLLGARFRFFGFDSLNDFSFLVLNFFN
jgi:hypothetical protein